MLRLRSKASEFSESHQAITASWNRAGAQSGGFALVISLMLMAFVLLLLLSVSTLVRVETSAVEAQGQHSMAQENALLALQIAVGELQKYAGPDQRATTTADLVADEDIDGDATLDPLYSTTPHLKIASGARYWTAIWGNDQPVIGYNLAPNAMPTTIGARSGMTPTLLNWLVSGNEGSSYALDGLQGGVEIVTAPKYGPNAVINLTDPEQPTVANTAGVVLVGSQSVDSSAVGQAGYVVAPLVNIQSTTNGQTSGRYAWWVGDEGVKARVDLQNGYQSSEDSDDEINSFIISQRNGIEFMDRDSLGSTLEGVHDFTSEQIAKLHELTQWPLTVPVGSDRDALTTASKVHFHDVTTKSLGVLADSYAGGLKKDLTADIADSSLDFSYRPQDEDPIFTPISASEINLPTWGHLRTWARTHPDDSGAVAPRLPSQTEAGFAPVLSYCSLGFDLRVNHTGTAYVGDVTLFPVIALYNPYSVPIQAANYEVGFKVRANTRLTIQTAPEKTAAESDTDIPDWSTVGEIDWGEVVLRDGDTDGTESEFIYFTVEGLLLPPGESHVYYLEAGAIGNTYSGGEKLVRAPSDEDANPMNYLQMPGSVTIDSLAHYLRLVLTVSKLSDGVDSVGAITYDDVTTGNSTGWGSSSNSPTVEVKLTPVDSINSNTEYYHRSPSMYFGSAGTHPDGQVIQYFNARPATFADVDTVYQIDNVNHWAGLTQAPRAAFRYAAALEGGGSYQAKGNFGLPQISTTWIRGANVRAPIGDNTIIEKYAPRGQSRHGNSIMGFVLSRDYVGGRDVQLFPSAYKYAIGMNGSMDAGIPSRRNTLFDILQDDSRLLSLGQLQHVPFSRYMFYPSYPFGNSYAERRVSRPTTYLLDSYEDPDSMTKYPIYDISYHLNRSIWDRYFLSTVPIDYTAVDLSSGVPLPNAHMIPVSSESGALPALDAIRYSDSNKQAYATAAANLLNANTFNVNSTSEQAWRAVLAGTSGLPTNSDYSQAEDSVATLIPYPRFSSPLAVESDEDSPYASVTQTMALETESGVIFREQVGYGNRGLYLNDSIGVRNDDPNNLVNELARTIVKQVRLRGPFLSLSDFVNRSLTESDEALGIKGALQSAIDDMESSQINPYDDWTTSTIGNLPRLTPATYYYGDVQALAYEEWDVEHYMGGSIDEYENNEYKTAYRLLVDQSAKVLTQADLLSTLGPKLTARSDTFKVRAYGEHLNELTNEVDGQAWCEAIVQRMPHFVDDTNTAETEMSDAGLSDVNRLFGRRFKVVSFRWLEPSEI